MKFSQNRLWDSCRPMDAGSEWPQDAAGEPLLVQGVARLVDRGAEQAHQVVGLDLDGEPHVGRPDGAGERVLRLVDAPLPSIEPQGLGDVGGQVQLALRRVGSLQIGQGLHPPDAVEEGGQARPQPGEGLGEVFQGHPGIELVDHGGVGLAAAADVVRPLPGRGHEFGEDRLEDREIAGLAGGHPRHEAVGAQATQALHDP